MKALPNYPLCIILYLIYKWAFRKGGQRQYGRVRQLSPGLIIKSGALDGTHEAEVIRYIKKRTSIRVPKVVMSSTGVLRHFVVMKCIDGEPLDIVWMRLTTEQQSNVVRQLRDMIEQLRALPPPDPFAISGLYSRKCKDHRVGGNVPFGPFKNESEFNDHLVRVSQGPFPHDPFLDETREMMCDTHRVVFTHGDFAPRNIMVKDDVVLALIDWENAGWYPEHWEYIKAKFSPDHSCGQSWVRALDDIMPYNYAHDWMIDKRLSDLLPIAM